MPNPRAFLQAFGLHKNIIIGEGCVLTKVAIKHIAVEQYRRYTFPLTLGITTTLKSASQVLDHVKSYVDGHQVVNSQYGNPYDCYIDDFTIQWEGTRTLLQQRQGDPLPTVRTYTVTCMGYGNRILPPTKPSR